MKTLADKTEISHYESGVEYMIMLGWPDHREHGKKKEVEKIGWLSEAWGFLIFILCRSIIGSQCCVSGIQQSDSVIHTHVSILFQILFPHRLL